MKERDEEALRNLKLFRGEGNELAAEAELELIRQSLREEADQGSWSDLFKGHNRRRTGVVCGVAFFFQATGQVFSGHYVSTFSARIYRPDIIVNMYPSGRVLYLSNLWVQSTLGIFKSHSLR